MNYSQIKILKIFDVITYEDYQFLFMYASEDLINKLNSLKITKMEDIAKHNFGFFYEQLTCEELAEFLFVLCNY